MLMVIFGAGASYDCDPQHPAPSAPAWSPGYYRLPLTNEIFADRFGEILAQHKRCHPLVPRLALAARRAAIEHELEVIRGESQRSGSNLVPQLADVIYYLRDVVHYCTHEWMTRNAHGLTGYAAVLSYIEEWRSQQTGDDRVCLVTFNYDTLLETALSVVLPTLGLQRMRDYATDPRYCVIKLHGSIDWQRVVDNPRDVPSVPSSLIERWRDLVPTISYMTHTEYRDHSVPAPVTVPAIAIPMETKTDEDFACPPQHVQVLRDCLHEVTHLLIVGWRGAEAHFLKLWTEIQRSRSRQADNWPPTLCAIQVVDYSHEAVNVVVQNIGRGGIRCSRVLPFEAGFSAFAQTGAHLNELLRVGKFRTSYA